MNSVISFDFESREVRVVADECGAPWFVAADVCESLGINAEATRRLDDDEKGLRTVQTLGGTQQMVAINESGLYSLILTSRKPEAKRFKKWVTGEVLPSMRKNGAYVSTSLSPKQSAQLLAGIESRFGPVFGGAVAQSVAPLVTDLDPRAAILAQMVAAGAMSRDAAERAGFMLLGLRPPRRLMTAR